ncbi:hypothetical protein SAMN05192532_101377 [Alteribacillus iranensis]|uniref:Uncharacterized protein n=1 Tax=Alteribacillus iranensis TaxID=930128 RepID=A0A1I1ZT13_9BACI|nr:hypothetical protein SAMN05192532_101377 [Alteribacillus iranensis]
MRIGFSRYVSEIGKEAKESEKEFLYQHTVINETGFCCPEMDSRVLFF